MRFQRKIKKSLVILLSCTLLLTSQAFSAVNVSAATSKQKKTKKVKLNKTKLTLKVGKTYKLKVKNIKAKVKVKWSSSKKKIATVNKKGKVTAKKKGTAKITAKVKKKRYVCKVTVKKTPTRKTSPSPKPTSAAMPSSTPAGNQPTAGDQPTAGNNAQYPTTTLAAVPSPLSTLVPTEVPASIPTVTPRVIPTTYPTSIPMTTVTAEGEATPTIPSTTIPATSPTTTPAISLTASPTTPPAISSTTPPAEVSGTDAAATSLPSENETATTPGTTDIPIQTPTPPFTPPPADENLKELVDISTEYYEETDTILLTAVNKKTTEESDNYQEGLSSVLIDYYITDEEGFVLTSDTIDLGNMSPGETKYASIRIDQETAGLMDRGKLETSNNEGDIFQVSYAEPNSTYGLFFEEKEFEEKEAVSIRPGQVDSEMGTLPIFIQNTAGYDVEGSYVVYLHEESSDGTKGATVGAIAKTFEVGAEDTWEEELELPYRENTYSEEEEDGTIEEEYTGDYIYSYSLTDFTIEHTAHSFLRDDDLLDHLAAKVTVDLPDDWLTHNNEWLADPKQKDLVDNCNIDCDVLQLKVTNNNDIWLSSVTVDCTFYDEAGNPVPTDSTGYLASMAPREDQYILLRIPLEDSAKIDLTKMQPSDITVEVENEYYTYGKVKFNQASTAKYQITKASDAEEDEDAANRIITIKNKDKDHRIDGSYIVYFRSKSDKQIIDAWQETFSIDADSEEEFLVYGPYQEEKEVPYIDEDGEPQIEIIDTVSIANAEIDRTLSTVHIVSDKPY